MLNWNIFGSMFNQTPLAFFVQSFWRDEAFSYLLAKKNILEILIYSVRDFSPPFYYLVLHYWIALFGKSEIAVRSLSFLFYWATLYLITHFLTDILKISLKKAILYMLFFAINPLFIYYAFEARMYTMFAFFATLSYYALYKKKPKLYVVASVLGLYTHYFMVLVIFAQYLFSKYKQKTALISFIPWMLFVLLSRGIGGESFWIQSFGPSHIISFLGEIYTGYEKGVGFFDNFIFLFSLSLWSLVIVAYIKMRKAPSAQKKLFNLLFVWGIGVPFFIALISFIKPIFLPRYLIFSSIGLMFFMVYAFEKFDSMVKTLLIIFFVIVTLGYLKMEVTLRVKAPLRQTFSEIKMLMNKNDSLYVSSELDYFTAQYYLGENKVYIYGKDYDEIPNYVGKVLINKDRIATSLPIYPSRAFVLNDGQYTIQALY